MLLMLAGVAKVSTNLQQLVEESIANLRQL